MNRLKNGSGLLLAALLAGLPLMVQAAETNAPTPIDLATALRLAGANNVDVQIAREKSREAQARHKAAKMQYFPWLSPSIGYRAHNGNIQDTTGTILDVDKSAYSAGVALNLQLELGDTIYKALEAKQLARAAEEGAEAQRQETVFNAAAGYFELSRSAAEVAATAEAVKIAEDYAGQVEQAVEAGIAFKGDVFRAHVQTEENRIMLRQARERQVVASAHLAQILRLPPSSALAPQEIELIPLNLVETNTTVESLIVMAAESRPELRQSGFIVDSTTAALRGTTTGPLIPTIGAQAYFGGLAGGLDGDTGDFGGTQKYFLGLSWKIGPGGLFDRSRTRVASARQQTAMLESEKVRQQVEQQVVVAYAHVQSLADQLAMTQRALDAAGKLFSYSVQRKEFGTGMVLETIQAERELTRARLGYFDTIAHYNSAQYALRRAVGTSAKGK